jgi:hypothetical protein
LKILITAFMVHEIEFYTKLAAKKFPWTPITPVVGAVKAGAEQVLAKALALRILELPVGEFVNNASKREFKVPDESKSLFLSNINDELIHDQQLQLAYSEYKITSSTQQVEAYQILQQWLDLDEHPLLKAMQLERSVFFIILPLLRMFGDTSLRTISQDISRKYFAA